MAAQHGHPSRGGSGDGVVQHALASACSQCGHVIPDDGGRQGREPVGRAGQGEQEACVDVLAVGRQVQPQQVAALAQDAGPDAQEEAAQEGVGENAVDQLAVGCRQGVHGHGSHLSGLRPFMQQLCEWTAGNIDQPTSGSNAQAMLND